MKFRSSIFIKYFQVLLFYFTASNSYAFDFCGDEKDLCRLDIGYQHSWSKNKTDGKLSDNRNMGESFIYFRRHGELESTNTITGVSELEYFWRSENSTVGEDVNKADELSGSLGLYYVENDIFNPEKFPRESWASGIIVNLSDHESFDLNSSFGTRLARRFMQRDENGDYDITYDFLVDTGFKVSDWRGSENGNSIFGDFQFRYGKDSDLDDLSEYKVFRIAIDHFRPDNNSFNNQTIVSLQPFIYRKAFSEINGIFGFSGDLYLDVVFGRDEIINDSGSSEDTSSYFATLGLSLSFDDFNKGGEFAGGGGGSGGRYYRP